MRNALADLDCPAFHHVAKATPPRAFTSRCGILDSESCSQARHHSGLIWAAIKPSRDPISSALLIQVTIDSPAHRHTVLTSDKTLLLQMMQSNDPNLSRK